ncbi:MAG: hypothetical protein GX567_06180 [Clostridia bacterium]|nr:hypothetical protein [Clostridia bacterium]
MKIKFKKAIASVMAAATLAISFNCVNASTADTYMFGDTQYGGNYYSLNVDNCESTGYFHSYSTMTRYCTVKVYLYNPNTFQTLAGSTESKSSNVSNGAWLSVSKNYNGHNPTYKHYYKADLYGGTVGPVPIVETVNLNIVC